MSKWNSLYVNDPEDDYNLFLEVYFGEIEYACIKRNGNDLEFVVYANESDVSFPVSWLHELLAKAQENL